MNETRKWEAWDKFLRACTRAYWDEIEAEWFDDEAKTIALYTETGGDLLAAFCADGTVKTVDWSSLPSDVWWAWTHYKEVLEEEEENER